MPAFNAAAHLRAALDSVLSQTFRDFELLVVDDGSTDASAEILSGYRDSRLRIERFDKNRGLSAALNHGLAVASADLIARLDADDVARADRLERQLACFRSDSDLVLLGSQARSIDANGRVIGTVQRPLEAASIEWYSFVDNPFIHSAVAFKRVAALAAGGYEAEFDPFSQDLALWWKLIRQGTTRNLSDCLVDYRVSTSSIIGRLDDHRGDDYRTRFARVQRTLIARHISAAYGSRGLSADEAHLLAGFMLGVAAAELHRFLDVFIKLLRCFESDHPNLAGSQDFCTTLARQFDAIAYRVRPATRRTTLRVYRRALREAPSIGAAISWSRMLVMLGLGVSGREQLVRALTRLRLRQAA